MPAAATSISTSPGPGSGTGRVAGTSTSGPPGSRASMTVMVFGSIAFLCTLKVGCSLNRIRHGRLVTAIHVYTLGKSWMAGTLPGHDAE